MDSRLTICDLSLYRNGKSLLHRLNFSWHGSNIVALGGDNGIGKTTLLKTLAGLLAARGGEIFHGTNNIVAMSALSRAQKIGFLLQESPQQPYCTARQRVSHGFIPYFGHKFYLDREHNQLVEKVAEHFHISSLLDRRLSQLSGGEQRLINICKCLVYPSWDTLLLDEPSVFLDQNQKGKLTNMLKILAAKNKLIIFSSHDRDFIDTTASDYVDLNQFHP